MKKYKYKVCVYAICKNESKFVERWVNSMKEADEIYVLDTGSDDNTVNLLQENGVFVKQERITPWRFDVARNKSLNLIPEDCDICVCTDLDEVFIEGWREKLEQIWVDKTDRLAYNYNWSLDENNQPIINFYIEKIHTRNNYIWTHPVHEVLTFTKDTYENKITTDEITLNHYPDCTKSRSNYLPLLELSVKEDPEDDRNMHYLGREYMYYQMWDKCIDTLIKHLELKTSTWKDERSASMRFIGRSYYNLSRIEEARMWYRKAILEAPYLKEPLVELAILEHNTKNYQTSNNLLNLALTKQINYKSYINESFTRLSYIYDLLSINYYYLNDISNSIMYATKALELDKNNERIENNLKIFKSLENNIP